MGNDDAKTTAEGAARDVSQTISPTTEGVFATRLGFFRSEFEFRGPGHVGG